MLLVVLDWLTTTSKSCCLLNYYTIWAYTFSWLFKVWTRDSWQGRYKTKRSEPRGFKIKVSWRKYCITYWGFIKRFKINKKLKISVCLNLKVINVHIYVFTIIIMAIIQSKRQGRFLSLTKQHNRTTVVWKR